MTAPFRNLVLALATAAGFCALTPSCSDNNQTIFIRQFQGIEAPDCTLTNDPTAKAIFGGRADLAITSSYIAYPLIGNQLESRGNAKQSVAEPNRVVVQGAEIELKGLDDSSLAGIGPFTVLATGTVDPAAAGSTDPSYGVSSVQLIPPAIGDSLRKNVLKTLGASVQIKATVKVFGRTLGNRDVESGPVDFPITICMGCSVVVSPEAAITDPPCGVAATSTGGTNAKTFCDAGQDVDTDCRLCGLTNPACRPCTTDANCAGLNSLIAQNPPVPAKCNTAAHFCE
jgi:hypothetical protein